MLYTQLCQDIDSALENLYAKADPTSKSNSVINKFNEAVFNFLDELHDFIYDGPTAKPFFVTAKWLEPIYKCKQASDELRTRITELKNKFQQNIKTKDVSSMSRLFFLFITNVFFSILGEK